jgi:hypothetical protein
MQKLWSWIQSKWRGRRDGLMREEDIVISTDDNAISATYPDGTVKSIPWANVQRVVIQTNDTGPWGSDVWWLFEGPDQLCIYPLGATGAQEALAVLPQKFPGFDDNVVIRAMGSTSNRKFVCWEQRHAF